jgi:hypothetical protein
MKRLKPIGLVMLVVLAGIQFIPSRTNLDKAVSSSDFIATNGVPENIGHILRTSCYNCHSNNTEYPWYSRVQPVGWFLQNHINKGKVELNFSEFGSYSVRKQKSKLSSMVSQVEKDEMPLSSYTFIHHEARLSQESKKVLINYLNALKDSL